MSKEIFFNHIYDAQTSFRVLLNAFSHPGTIYSFDNFSLNLPIKLYKSNAIFALSLFDNNISFNVSYAYDKSVEEYLQLNTSAKVEPLHEADYVFLNGIEDNSDLIKQTKIGELLYPEKNATIILSVNKISSLSFADFNIKLNLTGPGIKDTNSLFVEGLEIQNIETIKLINAEFPLGVDVVITDANNLISSIPRSSTIEIIQNN